MKTISVVTPCFNEEENIRTCYDDVKRIFECNLPGYKLEHIFTDNASTDKTEIILNDIASKDPSVKVIINSRNFGPFRSIFNGLRYATGDAVIVFMPADLQDPPELIPEFVRHWESGIEIVAGERVNREERWMLRTCRSVFYAIVNYLSEFDIPQGVGEFQLIDRKVWEIVISHDDHYPYIRGIIASCGFKRLIIPYTWRSRKAGKSKNNILRLIDQALNGIFSFTNIPLRICSIGGICLASICIIYAISSTFLYILFPFYAPKGIMTIIVSLFFLSAIQLIFIGILGEYITSIHDQVRKRPRVIERKRLNIKDPISKP